MAAHVTTEPDFHVERVRRLIDPWPYGETAPLRSYDVFPDGSFVAIRLNGDLEAVFRSLAARQIHVVLNFSEELKERAGGN